MMRLPAPPLFLQTLGLVIATLVAAQIAAIVIVFSLPPPTPEVYTLGEVVASLKGVAATPRRDAHPLTNRLSATPPAPATEGRRRLGFANAVARTLGIDPRRVVISQNDTRLALFGGPRLGPFGALRSRTLRPSLAAAAAAGEEPLLFGRFELGVRRPDGRWLVVRPRAGIGIDPWQRRLLLVSALAALVASPLAWAFSRRLAAPFAALADGAQRLGRDPHAPPLDIPGSVEVTAAVIAFNEMQERLRRYVEDRTAMVGAIAHDLRTPLTRLRFRIEAAPDDLRRKLAADIDQMDAMISAALGFVQDVASPDKREALELASLVETIMDETAETGADAALLRVDRVVVDGDALALTRLITNLVDNALKFGSRVRGAVIVLGDLAVIDIDDDGPGIPEAEMERVFEPFHRLEGSRNRDTGGIGLGLAVVRAVARSHGGDVSLSNRAEGGLRVRVSLPRALPVRTASTAPKLGRTGQAFPSASPNEVGAGAKSTSNSPD
jgi:two-component system, OmpR family, sensor kinase